MSVRDRPKVTISASAEAEGGRRCKSHLRPKPNVSLSYLSQLRWKPKVAEAEFLSYALQQNPDPEYICRHRLQRKNTKEMLRFTTNEQGMQSAKRLNTR